MSFQMTLRLISAAVGKLKIQELKEFAAVKIIKDDLAVKMDELDKFIATIKRKEEADKKMEEINVERNKTQTPSPQSVMKYANDPLFFMIIRDILNLCKDTAAQKKVNFVSWLMFTVFFLDFHN